MLGFCPSAKSDGNCHCTPFVPSTTAEKHIHAHAVKETSNAVIYYFLMKLEYVKAMLLCHHLKRLLQLQWNYTSPSATHSCML